MEDQLITFETAKLAKEKGFNIYQTTQYSKGVNPTTTYNYTEQQCRLFNDTYYAPTQSLLQKWLREVHNVHIIVFNNGSNNNDFEDRFYPITNYDLMDSLDKNLNPKWLFKTYEEALEFGLQEGLKLIKL